MGWGVAITGAGDGAQNMAFDEWLLGRLLDGSGRPMLRLYTFSEPTITIGYAQAYEQDIDVARCREAGVRVVRRPTGGRAVFHGGDLTYSVIARQNDPWLGGSIHETYRAIAGALGQGLAHLGIGSELAKATRRIHPSSRFCFATSARYELLVEGKKIVGSAQLRRSGVLLQQGSLPLSGDGTEGIRFMRAPAGGEPPPELEGHVTTVAEILGRRVGFGPAADAVRRGFEAASGHRLEPVQIDPSEDPEFVLLVEKYSSPDWNERRQEPARAGNPLPAGLVRRADESCR
jgi:lipoate-protein ligase A